MLKRFGSTSIASILAIGGLLALGVGGFAAYRSYTGGCGACCPGGDLTTTPVVLVEECGASCSAEAKSACAESAACCKGLSDAECCKANGGCESEKAGCEGEKSSCSEKKSSCHEKAHEGAHEECTGEKGEPTAATEKGSCGLCPSKAKG